jgi:hypothetical protein
VCDPHYEDDYEIHLLEFVDLGQSIGQRLPCGEWEDSIGCSMPAMRGLNVSEEL